MLSIKVSFLLLMFFPFRAGEPTKPYVSFYVEEYKYLAIDEMIQFGIPASITIAQAIVESNAGSSNLARETNNHFGIKCKDYWQGEEYFHRDDDRDNRGRLVPSCFRKYNSIADSYRDHSLFLANTDHYKHLFSYDKTDYELWALGLEICGYASDSNYAAKLIRTIEIYNLHELDYYTIQYVERSSLSPK